MKEQAIAALETLRKSLPHLNLPVGKDPSKVALAIVESYIQRAELPGPPPEPVIQMRAPTEQEMIDFVKKYLAENNAEIVPIKREEPLSGGIGTFPQPAPPTVERPKDETPASVTPPASPPAPVRSPSQPETIPPAPSEGPGPATGSQA